MNTFTSSRKVLFRVGPFPKLSETFIMSQIEALVQNGFDVSVLADEFSNDFDLITSEVIQDIATHKTIYLRPRTPLLQKAKRRLPYNVRKTLRATREKNAYAAHDVLICHFGWMGVEATKHIKGMDLRGKLITVFHGADMSSYIKECSSNPYEDLFSVGDCFLPISNLWSNKLSDLGAPKEKICLHRMGILPEKFSFKPRELGADSNFKFVTVGRLTEKKGTEFAIRAIDKLRDLQPEASFSLNIIGDGPLEADLNDLAAKLRLDQKIKFLGAIPNKDVVKELNNANAFILPSVTATNGDMEGIPVALMEAMASGIPVISTFHSGIPELVKDGITGLLAEERDTEKLAQCMQTIMCDSAKRNELVNAARLHVDEEFNNHIWNDRLSSLISKI